MYTKILVAEDLKSIHAGIYQCLAELHIPEIIQVDYGDDAMLRLKKAHHDDCPFQLLITDLSFKKDHRNQQYPSGIALAEAAKKTFPALKIIVFSIDDRKQTLRKLLHDIRVDAFVCKGRRGMDELKEAIQVSLIGKQYVSPEIAHLLAANDSIDLDQLDIIILELLAKGYGQDDISDHLKHENIRPNSLSTIEKRINKMKILLQSQNTVQLIAVSKDIGLI